MYTQTHIHTRTHGYTYTARTHRQTQANGVAYNTYTHPSTYTRTERARERAMERSTHTRIECRYRIHTRMLIWQLQPKKCSHMKRRIQSNEEKAQRSKAKQSKRSKIIDVWGYVWILASVFTYSLPLSLAFVWCILLSANTFSSVCVCYCCCCCCSCDDVFLLFICWLFPAHAHTSLLHAHMYHDTRFRLLDGANAEHKKHLVLLNGRTYSYRCVQLRVHQSECMLLENWFAAQKAQQLEIVPADSIAYLKKRM